MTLTIVIVLPDPVTPSSAWKRSFRSMPFMSSAIARGWEPAGEKGDWSWNLAAPMVMPESNGFGDCSGGTESGRSRDGVWTESGRSRDGVGTESGRSLSRPVPAPSPFRRHPLPARHFRDALHLPCRPDDLLQVREVLDL